MPQWDFLDFLAAEARRYPTFHLVMQAEVTGLRWERGRVRGVTARTPDGALEVTADLTVAADGRASRVRDLANMAVRELGCRSTCCGSACPSRRRRRHPPSPTSPAATWSSPSTGATTTRAGC